MTLKAARDWRELGQVALAEVTKQLDPAGVGVDQSHISKLERGEVTDPRNSTVTLLEQALRLPRGTLVFGIHSEAAAS